MSTNSAIIHDLPEFPYSPASEARRRHLSALPSSSHFVTTVVSPPPLAPAPLRSSSPQPTSLSCADQPENAAADQAEIDPPHNPDSSSTDTPPARSPPSDPPTPTVIPSVLLESALLHTLEHAIPPPETRSVGFEAIGLKSPKHAQPPLQAYSFKQSPALTGTGQECLTWPSPRRRSSWRWFKRMGNGFVTPLRSMGLCFTSFSGGRRAVACCEDFSSQDTSPGSSWYSSGNYPPEFIRAVLENNALFGQLAVE